MAWHTTEVAAHTRGSLIIPNVSWCPAGATATIVGPTLVPCTVPYTPPQQLLAAWQFQVATEEEVAVILPLRCVPTGATKQQAAIRPERLAKGAGAEELELEADPYQSQCGGVATIRPWPISMPQSPLHYAQ